jgi:glycine C-acetyltransferase
VKSAACRIKDKGTGAKCRDKKKYQNKKDMYGKIKDHLREQLAQIEKAGLFKKERIIISPQGAVIQLDDGSEVLNFCANNYLGLSSHPELIASAKEGFGTHGYGMSSVRFICGTTDLHKKLEQDIAGFFGTEDSILYAACFDANGGLFEPLLGEEDAIISDSLNHASIIDGVRLCKAKRFRYANSDMNDLEEKLKEAGDQRFRLIITDGVFSMDGNVAPVDKIIELAEKYDAMVAIDESHSAGVVGKTGRGVTELFNVRGRADIITGTLGKAFGGAIGGFTTGRMEIIEMLRQRSRPYLFSNSLPPMVVSAGIKMFEMMSRTNELQDKLHQNTTYFTEKIKSAGFDIKPSQSAIVAIMLYDARLSQDFAAKLLEEGIYVIGFYYPVVPQGQARIRVQLSAAHERKHLDKAISAFTKVGRALKVI